MATAFQSAPEQGVVMLANARPTFLPEAFSTAMASATVARPAFLPALEEPEAAAAVQRLDVTSGSLAELHEPLTMDNLFVQATAVVSTESATASLDAPLSTPLPPNFTGRWRMSRYEGDLEELLADNGLGWAVRKIAKSMNYGVGKQVETIQQEGDSFIVVNQGGPKVTTMRFRVGAGSQRTQRFDGAQMLVDPIWRGQALYVGVSDVEGKGAPAQTRVLEGDIMVVESQTFSGRVVRRFYMRDGHSSGERVNELPTIPGQHLRSTAAAAATSSPPRTSRTNASGRIDEKTSVSRDFTGTWRLESIEGDFDAFLKDAGVPWPARVRASRRGFDVGQLMQVISHTGNRITITSTGSASATTAELVVGAGEQESIGAMGSAVTVRPIWELDMLVVAHLKPWAPMQRRFMEGADMVVEAATTEGIVRQVFARVLPEEAAVEREAPTSGDEN